MPRSSFLAGLIFAIVLSACPAKPPARPHATGSPIRGGIVRVALVEDVDSLDPSRALRPSSWFFVRAMYRGLLAFPDLPAPEGLNPVPDLAASMPDVSADGLTYTFHLRGGIRFGGPVTRAIRSEDARASLQRVVATGAGIARFLSVITKMSTPDDSTLAITLSRVTPDLPWVLAQPQASIVPFTTPQPGAVPPQQISSSGPYRLASYSPEHSIVLERNTAWDPGSDPVRTAYLDGIAATINVAPARAFAQTVAGTADLVLDTGPPDARAGTTTFPAGARAMRSGNGCIRYLFMNTSVPPFTVASVRLAVAAAVVRARFDAAAPGGTPATRLLPPTVIGHDTTPVVAEDLGRARALLRHATLKTALIASSSPRDRAEASILRGLLARAGILIRPVFVAPALLYPSYYEQPRARVPMGIATWCADWPGLAGRDVLGTIAASSGYAHLGSHALARAIAAASSAPPASAQAAWASADAATIATGALVPLLWTADEFSLSQRLQGFVAAPMWPHGDPTAMWLGAPRA